MSLDWMNFLSLAMGLSSFVAGFVLWYRGSVEKRYAAERDFQHLKRNYESLAQYLTQLEDKLENGQQVLMTQILEIKGLMYGALGDRTQGGSKR